MEKKSSVPMVVESHQGLHHGNQSGGTAAGGRVANGGY